MAANGGQPPPEHYACKCLNIRIHSQPSKDNPPPSEAGFISVYVGKEGISVVHPELTLRSHSRAIPLSDSPTAELARFITVTCLVCDLLVYRVSQFVTPDLSADEGPILPTDDWVEKELCKSSDGWIEVYQGCLTDGEVTQVESSPMYSKLFRLVLPGGTPPSDASAASDDQLSKVENARGPSEHGKKHLPELSTLFLPPPFTPSNIVFSHISALATEHSENLRDEAEQYVAQETERKVAEILKAEAVLKREVDLIWGRFRENVAHHRKAGLALSIARRRSGHIRASSNPAPETSASVRINNFIPIPSKSNRNSPTQRQAVSSALSASLKTSGMQYPGAQREMNGHGNGNESALSARAGYSPPSLARSSTTRAYSPSTASSRTVAMSIDAETSIREAYRREMDESKDIATSFRYTLDIEAQMEQRSRALPEAEDDHPTETSLSHKIPAHSTAATTADAGRSTRVSKSAIKSPIISANRSTSPKEGVVPEDSKDKRGKRKVTFDVKPDVTIISKDEGEIASEQTTADTIEDPMFDMDNESEQAAGSREIPPHGEQIKTPPPQANTPQHVRTPPRSSHSRSSSNSNLPPQLQSLRPASLPLPSAIRPPMRHTSPTSTETAERSKALRDSLVGEMVRSEVVERPIQIPPEQSIPDEPHDPREEEILKLVAAGTPSHRSAWKKNSKAWQVFFSRRELRANEAAPEAIEEEGSYVLDDFDPSPGRRYNSIADSDATDEDEGEDNKWSSRNDDHPIAQSLPIPIGLNHHRQIFGIPAYEPKTSLSDRPGLLVPALRSSATSTSLRRASYAERDRIRTLDPGALDFVGDDDYDDDDVDSDPEIGGKARQRALKILKARNEMPAAGMWRSLA